jgi:hypothetical protein
VLVASTVQADSVAFSGGYGEQTNIWSLAAVWDRASPLVEKDAWRMMGQLEIDGMVLQGRRSNTDGYKNLVAVGATPVGRFEWPQNGYVPFIDLGIGINFLSHTTLQDDKKFSTAFQFGELLGVGLRFGQGGAYELGARIQHMSNGKIKTPNDGITFAVVHAAYHF